jgi:hypothetical protein
VVGGYYIELVEVFVRILPARIIPYDQRSHLTAKMRLEIEFFAAEPVGGAVNFQTRAINWSKPTFRLTAIAGEPSIGLVPALAGRPGGRPVPLNRWLSLNICY